MEVGVGIQAGCFERGKYFFTFPAAPHILQLSSVWRWVLASGLDVLNEESISFLFRQLNDDSLVVQPLA